MHKYFPLAKHFPIYTIIWPRCKWVKWKILSFSLVEKCRAEVKWLVKVKANQWCCRDLNPDLYLLNLYVITLQGNLQLPFFICICRSNSGKFWTLQEVDTNISLLICTYPRPSNWHILEHFKCMNAFTAPVRIYRGRSCRKAKSFV